MKKFVPTPTTVISWTSQKEKFLNRVMLFQQLLYSLFQLIARGIYFGIFAPVGAYSGEGGDHSVRWGFFYFIQ